MSFFEPPPPPPEPQEAEFPTPPWFGPPENALGFPVPLRLVLVRTDDVAIVVNGATAYSTGIEFAVAVRTRSIDDDAQLLHGDPFGRPYAFRRRSGEVPPEVLRFGVQFADGSKATTLDWHAALADPQQEPTSPVLMQRGGGGGGRAWNFGFWLWPLPPPGPLAFVCEWPARGIALTRAEVDSGAILAAAQQAETLWPDGGASPGGGVTGQTLLATSRARAGRRRSRGA
jgi:hypothetical protein